MAELIIVPIVTAVVETVTGRVMDALERRRQNRHSGGHKPNNGGGHRSQGRGGHRPQGGGGHGSYGGGGRKSNGRGSQDNGKVTSRWGSWGRRRQNGRRSSVYKSESGCDNSNHDNKRHSHGDNKNRGGNKSRGGRIKSRSE